MSLKLGLLGAGLMAAAAVAYAPVATAEPVWPVAGAEDARATIDDLQAQGYDVQINWVSGIPMVPLYRCKVTGIKQPQPLAAQREHIRHRLRRRLVSKPRRRLGRGRYRSRCRFLTATQILVNVKMTGFE